MTPSLRRGAVRAALVAVVVIVAVAHVQRIDWLPAGLGGHEFGFSGGDDWDARLHAAAMGEVAIRRARLLHWDPFAGFGSPLLANPEGFLLHPAFAVGTAFGTWFTGLTALYWTSLLLLFGGSAALARRLELPAVTGIVPAMFFVGSWEWSARLASGHLFVLGAATWPGALACAHAAMDVDRGREGRLLLGAAAGLLLGSALLGGSHYAMPMGLLLVLLVVWAAGAPRGPVFALAALLWVPLLGHDGPSFARRVLEAAIGVALLLGLRDRPREKVETAAGTALGLLASTGMLVLTGVLAVSTQGRLDWGTAASTDDLLAEGLPWATSARLEAIAWLPDPLLWVLVLLGTVGLLARRPALGLVVAAGAAAAFTQGSEWKPWLFWTGLPGTAALGAHGRWSWVLLMFPMLGLPALAAMAAERAAAGHARVRTMSAAAAFAVAGAVAWWIHVPLTANPPPTPRGPAPLPTDAGTVRGVMVDGDHPMALSVVEGSLRARREAFDYGRMVPPAGAHGRLVWGLSNGCPVPAPPSVRVAADVEGWRVEGPAGYGLVIAQRAVPGWSCDGAEIVDGWLALSPECQERPGLVLHGAANRPPDHDLGDPPPEQQWLTLELADAGVARCTWRSPGFGAGLVAQGGAILVLLGVGGVAIRKRRSSAPAPPPDPPAPG